METPILTTDYVRQCLEYHPETGKFFWKKRPREHFRTQRGFGIFNTQFGNKETGTLSIRRGGKCKYIMIRLDNVLQYAHILANIWMGVVVPEGFVVDHKDRDGTNNRWDNLHHVDHSDNNFNSPYRGKKQGYPRGTQIKENGRYTATMLRHGTRHYLGIFDTLEECRQARRAKAAELGVKIFID